ncbi:MAG: ABC transporter permease [Acidimicrobiales bacterium]
MSADRTTATSEEAQVLAAGAAGAVPATSGVTAGRATPRPPRHELVYFALRNRKLVIGLSLVAFLGLVAIVAPFFARSNPNAFVGPPMQPPSSSYLLGTTYFGQDVYSQLVNGLRQSFLVGVMGGGIAFSVATAIGFTAGYRGGAVDEVLNMLTNVLLVIPTLALLIIIGGYLKGTSIAFEAVFVGATAWPWAARAIRAQTLSLVSRDFVGLARLSGVRGWRIVVGEVAPNMSSYLFLTFILLFGNAILISASYDFLGFGPPNGVSLGNMMNLAFAWNALQLHVWWWFVPPGIAIMGIVGGLYVTNVGLDEVFNPKLRSV